MDSLIITAILAVPAFFLYAVVSTSWRSARGRCQRCNADLPTVQGRLTDRCPGCGKVQIHM